jgi:hypothetical protein
VLGLLDCVDLGADDGSSGVQSEADGCVVVARDTVEC